MLSRDRVGPEGIKLKSAILACLAALTLCSGCEMLDIGFIEDEPETNLAQPAQPAH